ncbi:hypothetical protein [Yinghuangia aomiensis]
MTLTNSFDLDASMAAHMWVQLGTFLLAHDTTGTVLRALAEADAAMKSGGLRYPTTSPR